MSKPNWHVQRDLAEPVTSCSNETMPVKARVQHFTIQTGVHIRLFMLLLNNSMYQANTADVHWIASLR